MAVISPAGLEGRHPPACLPGRLAGRMNWRLAGGRSFYAPTPSTCSAIFWVTSLTISMHTEKGSGRLVRDLQY
jgi:hypothetical protein